MSVLSVRMVLQRPFKGYYLSTDAAWPGRGLESSMTGLASGLWRRPNMVGLAVCCVRMCVCNLYPPILISCFSVTPVFFKLSSSMVVGKGSGHLSRWESLYLQHGLWWGNWVLLLVLEDQRWLCPCLLWKGSGGWKASFILVIGSCSTCQDKWRPLYSICVYQVLAVCQTLFWALVTQQIIKHTKHYSQGE